MSTTELLSALAANRKQFFDLVEAVERQADCDIDEPQLQGEIDANYAGRERLTRDEANDLLMKASRPKPALLGAAA